MNKLPCSGPTGALYKIPRFGVISHIDRKTGLFDHFPLNDIDGNCADQDQTGNDLLHVCVESDVGKTLFQENNDIGTDHCSVDGSVSAGSGHTADDGTTDGIQLHTGAGTRRRYPAEPS